MHFITEPVLQKCSTEGDFMTHVN